MSRRTRPPRRPEEAAPLARVLTHAARSSEVPLEPSTRVDMESRFARDFAGVRVHTDTRAQESAEALGAKAFTLGDDIYFGKGRYAPSTTEGRALVAHELTHVVQQHGQTPAPAACTMEPGRSAAEREADAASRAVVEGRPLGPIAAQASGLVQRSILGDIGGALFGVAAGALVGLAVGGPIGALIGGVLGGVAGLAIGDAESAEKRGLTGPEETEAELVFGRSLDYGAVKIAEAPIMAIGANARTPFDTIYFPPGTSKLAFSDFMPWLIHELTHAWQYQHGVSVATKLWHALHGAKAYEYGGEAALVASAAAGKHFTDFNTEQQGDILRDYYRALKAGRSTVAFDPFVAEVKAGGRLAATAPGGRAPAGP